MPSCYIHVWTVTSDSGPDQQATRNSLKTIFAQGVKQPGDFDPYKQQLIFELPCMKHQYHLICSDSLKLTDGMLRRYRQGETMKMKKYYGALAKIVHCWRAHAKKISNAWALLHPDHYHSDKAAKTLPPIPVSSRWGSITCIWTDEFVNCYELCFI